MSELRILTVRQPWAWAIFHGKDVENRSRNIAGDYRGPIAIHAAKARLPIDAHNEAARQVLKLTGYLTLFALPEALGAIIGVVDLVGVHHVTRSARPDRIGVPLCWDDHTPSGELCSPWAEPSFDAWHLELANPRPLTVPIPYRGALGLRRLPEDVSAQVWQAVA